MLPSYLRVAYRIVTEPATYRVPLFWDYHSPSTMPWKAVNTWRHMTAIVQSQTVLKYILT